MRSCVPGHKGVDSPFMSLITCGIGERESRVVVSCGAVAVGDLLVHTDNRISSVATARMVGLICSLRPENICRGIVL